MDSPLSKAVVDKKPIPEIDFTLHIMEDGSQVSTQERVCKGTFLPIHLIRNAEISGGRRASAGNAATYE